MTYYVESVQLIDDKIVCNNLMHTANKLVAYACAKRAAGRGARFDGQYGPTSVAYVGRELTAVVSRGAK